VGEVLKKYHPHGDSAVYEALVRMAQDFNMRYPLIDGQGNFGSIDGDPPAAYRYTEARLAHIAEEMLRDIDEDTVDFMPNFDETTEEPVVLPTRIPNLLINGSSGIAVGMATNIPPHNLAEVIDALVLLLEKPEATVEELMQYCKGPDFPTGGVIHGVDGIIEAYTHGRGTIKVRAKARIERPEKGNERIVITEIPYQTNKARIIEKIASLVKEKKIEGISEIRDESDRDGMRIVIELKRGEVPEVVLNNLYKHTQLETTFGIIMLALVAGQPRILTLRRALNLFLQHRREVVLRRTRFRLKKAEEKAHILEGLKIALDYLDEIIALIRTSSTPEEAKTALVNRYPLTEVQAQAILDMKLQRLTGLERKKIVETYEETLKEIEYLKKVLADETLVNEIIKEELLEVKKRYADDRRTSIVAETKEITLEDLITEEDMVITLTKHGYIKRTPLSVYRSQRRGGKGLIGMETKEEDYVKALFVASTHDYIMFFSNRGKAYWLKVYQIPEAGRASRGKAVVNLLPLAEEERITAALGIREFKEGYIFMVTKNGYVKKTPVEEFSNPRSTGIIAISLEEGDQLRDVLLTTGTDDIVLCTRAGQAIRFKEEDVRPMGRNARGVIGIRLSKDDHVVDAVVAEEGTTLLTVTERGYGKRTPIEEYPVHGRGGKGVITVKTTEKTGPVAGLLQVKEDQEIVIATSEGMLIRTPVKNIPVLGRNTQGVRLINLTGEDRVVGVGLVMENGA
ncbi:MAG: DNA gyrase subunit A, partial [Nitrospirae bacterium]